MSSPESERRRKRSDNTRGGRHFRDDKAGSARSVPAVKSAPEIKAEPAVIPEPEVEPAPEAKPEVKAVPEVKAEPGAAPAPEPAAAEAPEEQPVPEDSVDTIWDKGIEGEQGWTATAYSNTKKAKADSTEPEYVAPVEKEDRVDPEKMENTAEAETAFDYVVPKQTFAQYQKHPERSTTHSGKTKMASEEEILDAEEGFVFRSLSADDKRNRRAKRHHHHHHHHHHHSSSSQAASAGENGEGASEITSSSGKKHHHHHHHHRHRRLRKWMKVIIIILSVLMAIAIAIVGTFFVLREIGRRSLHSYENISIVTPTEESGEQVMSVIDSGRTLVYNGTTYSFNEDVVCLALVGVDHDIDNNAVQSMGDVIYLIGLDTESGKMTVISVSRDTMTEVNLYSDEGKYIDTERMQAAYAYSFGNKTVSGGANTAVSLSRLFYGLPVNNYFALNLDALTTLNDAIGGVTVTSSISFISPIDSREIEKGETITLHGREVVRYVRDRDTSELDSNSTRMQRQQEYIRAFLSQVVPAVKNDLSLVSNLYSIISVNSDTNLDLPKITYLASVMATKLNSTSEIEYLSLKGKTVAGEYAEFYADDTDVLETMLKVFYKQV